MNARKDFRLTASLTHSHSSITVSCDTINQNPNKPFVWAKLEMCRNVALDSHTTMRQSTLRCEIHTRRTTSEESISFYFVVKLQQTFGFFVLHVAGVIWWHVILVQKPRKTRMSCSFFLCGSADPTVHRVICVRWSYFWKRTLQYIEHSLLVILTIKTQIFWKVPKLGI